HHFYVTQTPKTIATLLAPATFAAYRANVASWQSVATQAAQRDRELALGDERDAADADLGSGLQHDLTTPRTVEPYTVLAVFVAEQPLALISDQASVKARCPA